MNKPNTNGMRFIADVIEQNAELYDQSEWGAACKHFSVAGTGVSCGTPACVAGFAVQFLGNANEYENRHGGDLVDTTFRLDPIIEYASHLLGLPEEWTGPIFQAPTWPLHWLFPPDNERWDKYPIELTRAFRSSRLYFQPRYTKERSKQSFILRHERSIIMSSDGEPRLKPSHKNAASFLRRLADQFDEEFGTPENKHHSHSIKKEEVTVA